MCFLPLIFRRAARAAPRHGRPRGSASGPTRMARQLLTLLVLSLALVAAARAEYHLGVFGHRPTETLQRQWQPLADELSQALAEPVTLEVLTPEALDREIAARRIVRYLKDALKLDVHEEWNCKRLDLEPIDMVGYTFRPHGRVNIRSGVFLRARRTFNRAARRPMNEYMARRCCSYYGYLRNSDSIQYRRRHRID